MHERTDQANQPRTGRRATPGGSASAPPPTVRAAPFEGWDAVWIERGPLTLILVPQVGGRIMSVCWHGRDGCVLEVFNAPALPYLELELHGPLASLQPGESFSVPTDAALFDLEVVPSTAAAVREGLGIGGQGGGSGPRLD